MRSDGSGPPLNAYVREIAQEAAGPASFQDLGEAVKRFGFKAVGLGLGFEQLKAIRIPAIAHLSDHGRGHFSVIRGIRHDGLVWLSDPSWGNRRFSESQFKAMWGAPAAQASQGQILLLFPEKELARQIAEEYLEDLMSGDRTEILKLLNSKNVHSLLGGPAGGARNEWKFREGYDFQVDIEAFYEDKKKKLIHVAVTTTNSGRFEVIPESECQPSKSTVSINEQKNN